MESIAAERLAMGTGLPVAAEPTEHEAKPAPLPRHLDILQVYRGAAATLVVLFHMTYWTGQPPFLQLPLWTPMLPTWRPAGLFRSGGNGVDLFFLLSGFVMVWGYGRDAGKPDRLLPFLWSRATRIYPTYWIVFALTVLYTYCRPGVGDPSELTTDALIRGFALYGGGPWQVPPSGTLPFELTMYLAFGMLFVVGRVLFVALAALLCSAVVAQWAGSSPWWFPSFLPADFFLTLFTLEFFLGALAAVFVRKCRPRASGWLLALALALWAVVEVVESVELGQGYDSHVRLCVLPYLLLIVVGATYELHTPRRYPWLLLLLGEASFSIYLTHYYVIWELNRFLPFEDSLGADGRRVVLLALVLAMGVGFWAVVERPLLKWLRPSPRVRLTSA